jgi:ADP-ribose pyrophosphatase YjhB (NUDIX family)
MALHVFRRLPTGARRRVVRSIAPGYTVGAMCRIERTDGHVLLVQLSYRNRWGVPGGLLKRGEDPVTAARREVLEEVSLEVDLVGDPAVQVDAEARRVDIVFVARLAPGQDPDQVRPTSPEIEAARWFAPDALPPLQPETSGAFALLDRRRAAR